jgi:aspartyl-tRNA(Asn)/glutamyl-tRNA(Gln) amidotransferase subunit A
VSEINIAGLPGVTVPAGYYQSGAPFNLIIVGPMWQEAKLLAIAYAYEQATRHRKAPVLSTE